MAITPFSAVPSRATGQDTFSADVETFWGQLPTFVNEVNSFGAGLSSQITTSSTTSLLVGTGSKTLTVGTGLGFQIGYPVRIAYSDSIHMTGTVTSYNPTTGELICNIATASGSGTYASWSVYAIQSNLGESNKFTGLQTFADEVAVASASTINITTADSNNIEITGTTTITAVTMPEGAVIKARASGVFQLTNSSSLIVQGGANYTTTVNDILTFTKDGDGNVHVQTPTGIATDAEAQAFSANKFIDGAKLNTAFKGSNQSLSTSGYQRLAGGLIIQWGQASSTPTVNFTPTVTVTFPIVFPTAVLSVCANALGTTDSAGDFVTISTKSTSQFTFIQWDRINTVVAGGLMTWIAIGH